VGTATVDGQSTTEYAVTIDPSTFLAAPGISSGETQAMQSAITLLGGGSILDDAYIDAAGDIVRTVSSIDGASLQVDLSNFGSAGTVTLPAQQSSIDSSTTLPKPIEDNCPGSGAGNTKGSPATTTTVLEPSTTVTTIPCISIGRSSPITTVPPPSSTTTTTPGGS
jgi:hypothetical protein